MLAFDDFIAITLMEKNFKCGVIKVWASHLSEDDFRADAPLILRKSNIRF